MWRKVGGWWDGARELGRGDEHLGHLRVQGELRHEAADRRQVAFVVQGAQVVEQLERAHERLGGGGGHEVEVDLEGGGERTRRMEWSGWE